MADEYISREAALELLTAPITMSMCLSVSECYNKREQREIDLALIKSLPAADVAPVRRGRWINADTGKPVRLDKDGCPVKSCHCSECGDWLTASDEYPARGRYCPNCGAKMDGGET